MKNYLMALLLLVGLSQGLQALDLQIVNNSDNTPLPVRLKSYAGTRKFSQTPNLATFLYVLQPHVLVKNITVGENFDHIIPPHQSLVINNIHQDEKIYLGKTGLYTLPLDPVHYNLEQNGISRITVTPTTTGYTYKYDFIKPGQQFAQGAQDVQTDFGTFTGVKPYKPGTIK